MTVTNRHIALICNPTVQNGKALALADTIVQLLQRRGISATVFTRQWPQVWDGFTEAWIVGGDGTVNYFINQYPGWQLPLTVFAGGTGNDLHWMLYGDMPVEKQVEAVLNGKLQKVDAGRCNGKLFLNGLGIGFDGAIVRDLLGKSKRPGKASYLLSVLKYIFRYKEVLTTVQLIDEALQEESLLLSVANGKRYGGGFTVAPRASLQDGALDVMLIGKISAGSRLRYLPYIERGDHLHLPFIQYRHTTSVVIDTAQPVPAHLDGEYFTASRFEVACLPHHFSFLL